MKYTTLSLLVVAGLLTACNNAENTHNVQYPESHKGTVADQFFGTTVGDPYRWLEYENTENVNNWIKAQNSVTQDYLSQIPFRKAIADRLKAIWNYPRQTVPSHEGENYFFSKNDGLQNQSVVYMQKGLTGTPKVFLDPNKLSADGTTALAFTAVSNDGKYFAYGTSKAGSDWNDIEVIEVETGKKTPDLLKWVKFSGASWYKSGFFYTRYPEPKGQTELSASNTNAKLYFHEMGKPQAQDALIFEYPQDPMIGVGAQVSEDETLLLVNLSKGASDNTALYWKNLTKPEMPIQPLITNYDNSYDFVINEGENMIFVTDKDAPKRRIVSINPRKPEPKDWKVIVPEKGGTIQSARVLGGKLLVTYMQDAKHQVKAFSLKGDSLYEVALPGLGSVGGFTGKSTDTLTFYSFTSFVQPTTIYSYNLNTNTSTVYKKSEVAFPFEEYETKQVFYTSKDGTKVPMFITHKKGLALNGNNPTYLYGYGGFNISVLPGFNPAILPFLEKGGVYASANLRGGGEYGDEWHKAGMLSKKQNVFDDFIAAAEYLIGQKYTSNQKLCISGRSNGGLLVGAVMAQRPELFKVALPAVGVMDMLRFQKFTIGHAWTTEYGSSEADRGQFETLFKYSPLHNLKEGTEYPATLVTTADHDDRVVPAHSFKFAARLQACQKGNNPTLIRIETAAGHGAGKSTTKLIEEWADVWAFVLHNMGVKY